VIGVAKAYSTRVGGGPFPTELDNEVGQRDSRPGREYGTTHRAVRAAAAGSMRSPCVYTSRLSGIDCISLMMMDVLSQLDEVKICVATIRWPAHRTVPLHGRRSAGCKPIYEAFPGWKTDVTKSPQLKTFPRGAGTYLELREATSRQAGRNRLCRPRPRPNHVYRVDGTVI